MLSPHQTSPCHQDRSEIPYEVGRTCLLAQHQRSGYHILSQSPAYHMPFHPLSVNIPFSRKPTLNCLCGGLGRDTCHVHETLNITMPQYASPCMHSSAFISSLKLRTMSYSSTGSSIQVAQNKCLLNGISEQMRTQDSDRRKQGWGSGGRR